MGEWRTDLPFGQFWEEYFCQWAERRWPDATVERVRAADRQRRDGIDLVIWSPKRMDVKADKRAHDTRNVFVETVSVVEKDIPGWAVNPKDATHIVVLLLGLGRILIAASSAITENLPDWTVRFETGYGRTEDRRYRTKGLKVPIDEFCRRVVVAEFRDDAMRREFLSKYGADDHQLRLIKTS